MQEAILLHDAAAPALLIENRVAPATEQQHVRGHSTRATVLEKLARPTSRSVVCVADPKHAASKRLEKKEERESAIYLVKI